MADNKIPDFNKSLNNSLDNLFMLQRKEKNKKLHDKQAEAIDFLRNASKTHFEHMIIERYKSSIDRFKSGVFDLKEFSIYIHDLDGE